MVENIACAFHPFHYLPRNRNASQERSCSASTETTMILLLLPALASIASWVLDVASLMLARALNIPQPLVICAGMAVFVQVEALETSVGRSLCPRRLAHRLRALWRA